MVNNNRFNIRICQYGYNNQSLYKAPGSLSNAVIEMTHGTHQATAAFSGRMITAHTTFTSLLLTNLIL